MNLSKVLKGLFTKIHYSVKRFPITLLISATVALILIIISETSPNQEDYLSKLVMIFALGIPLSLCLKLYIEKRNIHSLSKKIPIFILGIIFLLVYYFILLTNLNMVSITRYTAVSLFFYLLFLYIPYFYKRNKFEMYIIVHLKVFFTTIIYSAILFAGLSIILFTIDNLLGIEILGKIYYYTFLCVAFLFAPGYYLAGVPKINDEIEIISYPSLLRVLILYIVIPLISIYTFILYIYFCKIIITQTWPVGMVSHLVLWYSMVVIFILFLLAPIKKEVHLARIFQNVMPKIMLPLLVMLFISIGIRINSYGITENRYYLLIASIWVFALMLYFSLKKNTRNIIIPLSLSIIVIFSVIGPQSSFNISKYSQNKRFEDILVKNNMLEKGKIKPSDKISDKDKANLSSILTYFENSHKISDIKCLPKGFTLKDSKELLGFPLDNYYNLNNTTYFNYTLDYSKDNITVTNYDYLIDMKSPNKNSKAIYANYDYGKNEISIYKNNILLYKNNINGFIDKLYSKYNFSEYVEVPGEDMTLEEENSKIKIKIVFLNISGNRDSSNPYNIDCYILIKIK